MAFSGSNQPDLDWSQIRETVKLLAVSVAQVEGSLKIGDESVSVLAASFTEMVDDMSAIQDALEALPPSEQRDSALRHCSTTQEKIYTSIFAFQFYDRLQQCLEHVSIGLKGLSSIIETPNRLYNPAEWCRFQEEIRGRYTMETEKIMFDAIHEGKTIEEALALANDYSGKSSEDEIEIF
ncbi:hypothetical protein NP590_14065 [Methylomonas sp. SURF-2]|uniref:Chemotaxis protein n=1 Tax=Methylomonas subterranea TaxID=2952225 RepID=A0ABT1TID8_9GAMM|nr:hypothetical protein [Methylomonas sp. SURF-2]MCQ8105236.1 hypothetical protein [Methylomonas sp. SURF-2]